jgi:hypothetical protein
MVSMISYRRNLRCNSCTSTCSGSSDTCHIVNQYSNDTSLGYNQAYTVPPQELISKKLERPKKYWKSLVDNRFKGW